jgi:hypothetical protein
MKNRARVALAALPCFLVVAACSSSSPHAGPSGSSDAGGGSASDSNTSLLDAPVNDAAPDDVLCAYKTDGSNEMACGANAPGLFDQANFTDPIVLCVGDAKLCNGAPSSVTLKITSLLALPLKLTLLYCPDTFHNGADCVPASREMGTAPLSITTTWGEPNGNVGPMTTLTIEQTGPSTGACSNDTDALGTDIQIQDPYGNELVIPYVQTACCATPSTPCP